MRRAKTPSSSHRPCVPSTSNVTIVAEDASGEEVFFLPERAAGLSPDEVDHRLGEVRRAAVEVNAHLAFWLFEVKRRALYIGFGLKNVADYAYARHNLGRDLTYPAPPTFIAASEVCLETAPISLSASGGRLGSRARPRRARSRRPSAPRSRRARSSSPRSTSSVRY